MPERAESRGLSGPPDAMAAAPAAMSDEMAAPVPGSAGGTTMPSQPGGAGAGAPATSPAAAKSPAPGATSASKPPIDARIVYTGAIGMREDAEKMSALLDRVIDVAEASGGLLAGRTDTSVTVKIPSAQFRAALTKVDGLGEVLRRSVTAEDVSAEFNDLEVRLENLRATRKRVEEFFARATSVADALTVEKELERITVEIDRIQGRLKFLRDRTSFSFLTVSVEARPKKEVAVVAPPPPPPSKPGMRDVRIPAPWLSSLGVGQVLKLD